MKHAPDLLRIATAGSVDDGKSTLVGRLLYDTKSVLADQIDAVTKASVDRGLEGPDLSLLVDGLRAEREHLARVLLPDHDISCHRSASVDRHLALLPDLGELFELCF